MLNDYESEANCSEMKKRMQFLFLTLTITMHLTVQFVFVRA